MFTAGVFLDIEKVFDTTWHCGLLYKLYNLEFSTSLIKLIGFFLSQRKLIVSVEGEMSTTRVMQAGVPQGSVLSPTLFNMYIQHIQGLCQFRLSTADHALLLVAPATTAV
jgi:retron-type reverse transcriptase